MDNGFYAARVEDNGVRSVHVDEDTVYYLQTAKMIQQRDEARRRAEEAQKREDHRQYLKRRRLILDCARWIGTGALVAAAHFFGLPVVIASVVVCFGVACYRIGNR